MFAPWSIADVEQSLAARFALQVSAHGSCQALEDRSGSLTYDELDRWSNGIAHAVLERLGAGSEPVPLLFHQGAASTAATLGVLKSGKAYVPLDPDDPSARLRRLLERLGARLVLHDSETHARASSLRGRLPLLNVERSASADASRVEIDVTPDDVAYVFFTSGSTGEPKGVFDSHRNVLHNVLRYTNALGIRSADRLTLVQAPAFSGAVSSLFCALLNGAEVFPFRTAGENPTRLAEWLLENRITIYHSVPAIFRAICAGERQFPDVRVVRLEGDRASALDVELHRGHFTPGSELANGLGTTETGLARQLRIPWGATIEGGIVPVGYRVSDVDVVILDESGAERPAGDSGEIGVRSAYLALGYWDQPDLTDRAFLADPSGGDLRTYRTGDIGRLRPDGCLEYLGRRDFQLKVLGTRIDPAEVEDVLLRLPSVREAIATTCEGRRGQGRLVAYLVLAAPLPAAQELRAELASRLPAAMIPSAFVVLDELPLGENGKLDRSALPPPLAGSAAGTPPRDEVEERLVRLWRDVLEVPVGVDDDFYDLGGDSLAAAEVIAALEADTGRSLSGSLLLRAPTIAQLAVALNAPSAATDSTVVTLQGAGLGPPLVLVHGHHGDVGLYASLVRRLGVERPVVGLELRDARADLSIEAVARRHIMAMQDAGNEAPYLLAGFCYGAVVAFEMARQLQAAGEDVGSVVLIGVSPNEFPDLVTDDARRRWERAFWPRAHGSLLARAHRHTIHARSLPRGQKARYLRSRVAAVAGRSADRFRSSNGPRLQHAAQAAFASYVPAPYAGKALLVLSSESAATYTSSPDLDWRGLALAGVTTRVLPGSDEDLLRPPAVDDVAALLLTRL